MRPKPSRCSLVHLAAVGRYESVRRPEHLP
jgi:hypothetical protein